jgi:hypothetical protein
VQHRRIVSHAEVEQQLRRLGYSQEFIEDLLGDFPDPFDSDRDSEALFTKHGLTFEAMMDRMGAGP